MKIAITYFFIDFNPVDAPFLGVVIIGPSLPKI
jgi:hypothetical protein